MNTGRSAADRGGAALAPRRLPQRLARPCRRWPLGLVLFVLGAVAAAEEYAVTIQGERAGTMSVRQEGDAVRVDYSYRNNGRGPDMQEEFRVGPQRQPVSYRVRGRTEFGGEIRFEAIPKTSTGKIQKFQLRERAKSASAIE